MSPEMVKIKVKNALYNAANAADPRELKNAALWAASFAATGLVNVAGYAATKCGKENVTNTFCEFMSGCVGEMASVVLFNASSNATNSPSVAGNHSSNGTIAELKPCEKGKAATNMALFAYASAIILVTVCFVVIARLRAATNGERVALVTDRISRSGEGDALIHVPGAQTTRSEEEGTGHIIIN